MIISSQKNLHDQYVGTNFSITWLILPCGSPVSRHIEKGAQLEVSSEAGNTRYRLRVEGDGVHAVCLLDPTHDWLPAEVKLDGVRNIYWKVTSFAHSGGRWFPVEGSFSGVLAGGETEARTFTVRNLRVNQVIAGTRFTKPEIPEGVIVREPTASRGSYVYSKRKLRGKAALELRRKYVDNLVEPTGTYASRSSGDEGKLPGNGHLWLLIGLLAAVATTVGWLAVRAAKRHD